MKSERCRTDAEDAWADLREDSQLPGPYEESDRPDLDLGGRDPRRKADA